MSTRDPLAVHLHRLHFSGSAASSLDAELRAWRTAFDTYLYEDMAHAARHFNEAQKLRALNGG